jgi:hypothetical protein
MSSALAQATSASSPRQAKSPPHQGFAVNVTYTSHSERSATAFFKILQEGGFVVLLTINETTTHIGGREEFNTASTPMYTHTPAAKTTSKSFTASGSKAASTVEEAQSVVAACGRHAAESGGKCTSQFSR